MSGQLNGKVALVTGAGAGIGEGVARRFADAGADVVISARTAADLDSVAESMRAAGRRAVIDVHHVVIGHHQPDHCRRCSPSVRPNARRSAADCEVRSD